MTEANVTHSEPDRLPGLQGVVADFASDQRAFKNVHWGKAMMWIFLLSDTFIFSSFLISYMNVRISTVEPWPFPSEVFALHMFGADIPLILIAIMTFVLITSSGTMALAVNFGYRQNRKVTTILLVLTALLGAGWYAARERIHTPRATLAPTDANLGLPGRPFLGGGSR